jgi:hypothetical protein
MAVLAAALIAPASAGACDEPHGSPDAVEAGPGDEVGFVIPTTLEGAAYELTVEGEDEAVARGRDETEEPGVSGEFTMPDLGSEARQVAVVVHVTHEADGADWRWEMPLDYRGSESAPSPPASQPSSTPAPPRPAPASTPASRPATSPPPARGSAPTLLPQSKPSPADGKQSPVDRVLGAVLSVRSARPRSASPGERRRGRRRARRAKRRANSFQLGREPPAVKGRDVRPPRDPRKDLSGEGFAGFGYSIAWKLMAGVVVAGLMLPLLLGGLARRRQAAWR